MIDEEKLEQLLENDYGELYKELQFMPVNEFIAKNKEKLKAVPGFLDLYNVSSNAPHGLTEEQIDSYFDKESDKENYRKSEAEYNKQLEESKKEAEGFDPDKARRKEAIENYQYPYFGLDTDNPISKTLNFVADAVISPGTKQAIIEDEPENAILARGISDIAAAGADALPGVGGLLVGPSIRAANRLTNDDLEGALADIGLDYGGNLLLNEGIQGLAGINDLGPVKSLLDKLPFDKWAEIVKRSRAKNSPRMKGAPAENSYDALKKYVDLPIEDKDLVDQIMLKKAQEAETKAQQDNLMKDSYNEARRQRFDEADNADGLKLFNQKWVKGNKAKSYIGPTVVGAAKAAEKGIARKENKYLRSEEDPKQRKYDSALDWIIKENERMWKAGFRPHEGIELEAWKKWKGIK